MKISSSWLREHLELELSAAELSELLLRLGFEVSGTQRLGPAFAGVVAAKVVSRDKHPNADKLSVCVVDDGARRWNVVCGAANVAAGQTVAFAREGASLPSGLRIGKARLRGVESQGMICSRAELGLPEDSSGIWVLNDAPALGVDIASLLGPADDVLDVEVTSNRPDCLSHRGLARELAAYFRRPLKPLTGTLIETLASAWPVAVEDSAACPFYGGRLIEGVAVGPSPDWLKRRLEAIGLRPINAVVDVANFVLHDVGHPLHAFDADRLAGGRLAVRRSRAGETLAALDHRTHALPEGLLVVADAEKPVALAGVMGSEETAVTEKTTRILLEAAYFAPAEVRRASQKTRLRSDSSYRFERGADPEGARTASARAAGLILSLSGGRAARPTEISSPRPRPAPISTSASRINAILGASFAADDIKAALGALSDELTSDGDAIEFRAPSWRHDLASAHDLAEETGRFLGYDKIPDRSPALPPASARATPIENESRRARARMSALGLWEAYNYDFLSEKSLAACRLTPEGLARVANPLSEDWAFLRPSLLPGLLKNAQLNISRGADALRLFELGKTYAARPPVVEEGWRLAGLMLGPVLDARWLPARAPRAGFHDAKAIVEELLSRAGDAVWVRLCEPSAGRTPGDPLFHPVNALRAVVGGAPVATVGCLHPRVARGHDLEGEGVVLFDADLEWLAGLSVPRPRFAGFSRLPASCRDIALVVDRSTPFARVEAAIRSCAPPELKSTLLFDVYEGREIPADKKSLAFRLTFGRDDRTLTDLDVSAFVEAIVAALDRTLGAKLRS